MNGANEKVRITRWNCVGMLNLPELTGVGYKWDTQGTTMARRTCTRTRRVTEHRIKRWVVIFPRMNDETRTRS